MFFKSQKMALAFTLDVHCLSLEGVVNAGSVAAFMKGWQKQQETNHAQLNRVDWSRVTESDSTGLAMMLALRVQQEDSFLLDNLPSKLVTLLHLYDLDEVFEFTTATPEDRAN